MDKALILNKIKDTIGIKKDSEFARYLNISPQTLSNWKSRNTYDAELLYTKCLELNPEWLLTGHGSMLKSESKVILTESYKGIPLIPYDALAGFGEGSMVVMEDDANRYIVPEFDQLQVDFIIKIKGDSMVPKYYGGNLVACKKIALGSFFQWNKVYVLDTDQGPLIKRVNKSEKNNAVLLVSYNKDYEPFDIELKDVFSLAIVVGMIGFE